MAFLKGHNLYKEKYGDKCMNPECNFGFNTEVHHIVPHSKGGLDDERNYIILCQKCHKRGRRHSRYQEYEITLATWKYYFESVQEATLKGNKLAIEKTQSLSQLTKEQTQKITLPIFQEVKEFLKDEFKVIKHKKIKFRKLTGGRKVRPGFSINGLKLYG